MSVIFCEVGVFFTLCKFTFIVVRICCVIMGVLMCDLVRWVLIYKTSCVIQLFVYGF